MQSSLIHSLHHAPTLMRSISATVIVTFTMLILTPTVVAARTELDKIAKTTASANTNNSAESQLSQTLQAVESQLQQMSETSNQPQARAKQLQKLQKSSSNSIQTLQNLKQQLVTLDKEVLANFAQIETELLERQLPQVILDRHQNTVDRYRSEINQLLNELDNVSSASNEIERQNKVEQVIKHLKAKQNKPTHQKLDPKHLPFQASENKARPPKETPEELEQLIQIDKPVQVAALELTGAMLAQASPSLTPNDEDLLPTEDVQITDEIKALAEQLEHQPVKIFNWVRNNIEYIPTYGSIQGSQMTQDNQRGNAFDTASLLIALLRASNIPARYAYGTVQIPIEKVMNWVGGVESEIAALELMLQGGIPASGLAQGGVIKFAKMEHVWVEAWVDYFPSRGAKNKTGDSWIPMDASFKQYEFFPGLDTNAINSLDNSALVQWMQNIQSNPAEGWSNGFDITSFETLLTTSEDILDTYFEQIEYQFFVDKTRIIEEPPVLASGLPYNLIARSNTISSLPESMRLYLQYALYASETDRILGNPVYSYKESLPKLAGKQISIGFKPASDSDRAIIESYLPVDTTGEGNTVDQLPTTFPAYLVRVNAQLKLAGQKVAGGGTFTLGQELSSVTSITKVTGGWHHAVNHPVAGEYYALGIDLQGISDKQHRKQPVTTVDSILHQTAIAYFSNADAFLENLRSTNLAITYRLPSFGLFGSSLSTIYNFGIPRFVEITRTQFDVDAAFHMIVTPNNNKNQQLSITRQIGMHISALEHQIPQVYLANNDFPGQAVSTISAIAKAVEQGQRIYSITATNINTVLSSLNHSVDVKYDIRNAINAGMEAVIPQNEIQLGNWNGTGYMIIDPKTGSAAYRINGGSNGSSMDNDISTAVSTAGIFGGADIHINWPKVSADDGECGEGDNIQTPLMDMLAFYILMGWFLTGFVPTTNSDEDCPCGSQPAFNVTATLLLWFRDMNAALANTEGGCPVFISGRLSQAGKEMWATSEHIETAQGSGAKKWLTWKKPEEREDRKNADKKECISRDKDKTPTQAGIDYTAEFGSQPADCDEYPFNSTVEGDPSFYKHPTAPLSLKLVPSSHNKSQGGTLNWFYTKCHIPTNKLFEVRTDLSEGSKSRGLDGNGMQCYPE